MYAVLARVLKETLDCLDAGTMSQHLAVSQVSQQLKAENEQLKAENKSLRAQLVQLEGAHAGLALHVGEISAHAFNLEQRAATAESLNKNNVQIHNIQTQLKTFETECEALRSENDALHQRNKALEERCGHLEVMNKALEERFGHLEVTTTALESRVGILESEVASFAQRFETRDAMRDLEWFMCAEFAEQAGLSKRQIKKDKAYNFQRLKDLKIDVPDTFSAHKTADFVKLIKHYKEEGNRIAHGPSTEENVRKSMEDEEDDEEDKLLKQTMLRDLSAYHVKSKSPFGGPVKR